MIRNHSQKVKKSQQKKTKKSAHKKCPTTTTTRRHAQRRAMSSFVTPTSTPNPINKTSLMFTVSNSPGALSDTLQLFRGVNLTKIESKPCIRSTDYEFHVDFDNIDEATTADLLTTLKARTNQLAILQSQTVPWFPRSRKDLDTSALEILDAGVELQSDHPGFHDKDYRQRRDKLAAAARAYRYGDKIPHTDYTPEEEELWKTVYSKLKNELWLKHGCDEIVRLLPLFEHNCNIDKKAPQLQEISEYLQSVTGFTIRPVSGLVSARAFLNALAVRTFFCTNYLRHPSSPTYTPEPDLLHELAHAAALSDRAFADFSQTIGLLSLGATEEQLDQLGKLYWFTVEFGLVKDRNGDTKALGAGVLSSIDEIKHAMGELEGKTPQYIPFNPAVVAKTGYPITTLQPTYVVADSVESMKTDLLEYAKTWKKPFAVQWIPDTQTIDVDSNIKLEQQEFKRPENVYANE